MRGVIRIKRVAFAATAATLILFYPATAFGQSGGTSSGQRTNRGSTSQTGPSKPTGSDASSYTYNETTGMWENDKYIWNPATGQTTIKATQTPTTSLDTPASDTATAPTTGTMSPVSGDNTPLPSPQQTSDQASSSDTHDTSGQTEHTSTDQNLSRSTAAQDDKSVNNNVSSTARSGDAAVAQNSTAGSAITGNATDMATVLNMLQSSWNPALTPDGITTFVSNIDGNVIGDLQIDPALVAHSSLTTNQTSNQNYQLNDQDKGQISNNINLSATSGNALVSNNTTAGDATSGSADAVANVVNVINTAIGSGQSFIGAINITGSFNGDILLPPGMLDQLLASNSTSATATTSSNQSAQNNVTTTATSGNAAVGNNTSAGSATSGNASTNVTILNLSKQKVVGANSLLVFVNVTGKWVGLIMDAPGGSTAAALGGGITSNSTNTTTADANVSSDQSVTNNITVASQSGNADVHNNTIAGSATTGRSSASANLANIFDSQFSLTNWFGVLFINVFGSWNGSFGVNTSAGDTPVTTSAVAAAAANPSNVKVFKFDASPAAATKPTSVTTSSPSTPVPALFAETTPQVLSASTTTPVKTITKSTPTTKTTHNWTVPASGLLFSSMIVGSSKVFDDRKHGKVATKKTS